MSFIESHTTIRKSVNDIKYIIPEIQRNANIEHIDKIYEFQNIFYIKNNKYCLNGSISIGKDISTGLEYLLDGQHRMFAYDRLSKDFPEREMIISVDMFECADMKNIELTYEYVNTNNPNPITTLGIDRYKIIKSYRALMENQFDKAYFKKSDNPKRPSINLDSLEKAIEEKDFIQVCNIKSGQDLFRYTLLINKYYCNLTSSQYEKYGIKNSATIIDKINRLNNKLFLGMYTNFEWLDRLIEYIAFEYVDFDNMNHNSYSTRFKITKNLKKIVWRETNKDSITGSCYCCGEKIEFDNFECGHIIPVSKGGEQTAVNMKPLCSYCNLNMGSMNLEEYKRRLHSQVVNFNVIVS